MNAFDLPRRFMAYRDPLNCKYEGYKDSVHKYAGP